MSDLQFSGLLFIAASMIATAYDIAGNVSGNGYLKARASLACGVAVLMLAAILIAAVWQ